MKLHEPQPFFVVRVATPDEYEADVVANGGNPARAARSSREIPYFYEVSTD